jgi:ATP-citrate lyase beta-subunit
MAKKAIREYNAKRMMAVGLPEHTGGKFTYDAKLALVGPDTDMDALAAENDWLKTTRLVVKPDQLFGKRGKNDLLLLDADWDGAKAWIGERMNKEVTLEASPNKPTGTLTHFLVEPFVPHGKEYYVAMTTGRNYDTIFFSTQGGVDIESVWDTVKETHVKIMENIDDVQLVLPDDLEDKETVSDFVKGMYKFFIDYHFTYLEINPFALEGGKVVPLDTVARVDDYASFSCAEKWGGLEFPKAFGMARAPEEKRIEELDERTGASLKLNVLNPKGRIWNLVAGGGASVIYADTVCDLGYSKELANYGEYSGNPSTEDTYEYTKTVLDLMTREKDPEGKPKYLMVGGGIANFTDVANTFTGIIRAIEEYKDKLKEVDARIYVRRGGPNWEGGVGLFENLGDKIGIPVEAHGPAYHMTRIVRDAFEGKKEG